MLDHNGFWLPHTMDNIIIYIYIPGAYILVCMGQQRVRCRMRPPGTHICRIKWFSLEVAELVEILSSGAISHSGMRVCVMCNSFYSA